jgi:hypothetical protein
VTTPLERTAEWGLVGLLLVALAVNVLVIVGWNDFMYGVGPVMDGDLALYRDIPFTQAPGSFVLLAVLADIVGPSAFYWTARAASWALAAGCLFLVYDVVRALADARSARLALVFALSSFYFPSVALEIGNYSLVLFLLLVATRLALLGKETVRDWVWIGACLGFSVAAKLTHAFFTIPFGLWLLWRRGFDPQRLIAFVVSGLVAGAPLFYYLLRDFEATWFYNVDIHLLIYVVRGLDPWVSFVQISGFTAELVSTNIAPLAVLTVALVSTRRGGAPAGLRPLAALTGIAYGVAVSPGVIFDQYFAPVSTLLAMSAGVGVPVVLRALPGSSVSRRWHVLWAVALVSAAPYLWEVIDHRLDKLGEERIVPLQLARIRSEVGRVTSRELAPGACSKTAFSMTAIPLLGGEFELSPFSAGSTFAPQIDHLMPSDEYASLRVHTSIVGELMRRRPTVVVAGFYEREATGQVLLAWLEEAGYLRFPLSTLGRRDVDAYLAPECVRRD